MSGPTFEPAGIVEVAALSGFSPATVSRALRGLPGVSATTRVAVEQAASQLGYFPSPSAAALTTGKTNAIGIIAPWVSRWFFSAVVEGAQEVLQQQGYDLLLYPIGAAGGRRQGGLDTRSLTKRVDGLLALNVPLADKSVVSLRDLRVPVVTVGTAVEGMSGVLVDNIEVGRQATQHLLDLGHRRIGFFGDDLDEMHGFTAAIDRHRGYDLTLRAAGLEPDPGLSQRTGFSMDGGEAALHRAFSKGSPARDLPTAVFAVSDEVAMGVLYAARERGLKVPGDLSIVGVDGHDFAYLFHLTTISQPVRDQGRIAARLLLEQVNSQQPRPPSVVSVGCELIRRSTTGPVLTPRIDSDTKPSERKQKRTDRKVKVAAPVQTDIGDTSLTDVLS
jgi:LacI family transcriptional regulator, repressor for deo operon, udp, cdd, tsx, nupC, and nupG